MTSPAGSERWNRVCEEARKRDFGDNANATRSSPSTCGVIVLSWAQPQSLKGGKGRTGERGRYVEPSPVLVSQALTLPSSAQLQPSRPCSSTAQPFTAAECPSRVRTISPLACSITTICPLLSPHTSSPAELDAELSLRFRFFGPSLVPACHTRQLTSSPRANRISVLGSWPLPVVALSVS